MERSRYQVLPGDSRLGGVASPNPGGEPHLVYEHGATEAPPAGLLQDGEGTVIPNDHHLHGDALSPGLLPGQAEIEPISSVVLHDEEGPHCRSSQWAPSVPPPTPLPPPAGPPGSSPSCTPGLPVPTWATALMAARMLPTAGEVNTAPAMTPVSIPFPMKPGDGWREDAGCEPRLSHTPELHGVVSPTVCLMPDKHLHCFPRIFTQELSPRTGLA